LENLSVSLNDLAGALRHAGRLDEALSMAERGLDIGRALGHEWKDGAKLGQVALILMDQGRYQEAAACYDQALEVAQRIGDQELERKVLQDQGALAHFMKQDDRAIDLYKQALRRFQDGNDYRGVMSICNLLGTVEQSVGRLLEARAWYERSRETAQRLGDTEGICNAVHNTGTVCFMEGQESRHRGDETIARQRFAEAERFLQQCLRMWIDLQNKPGEAAVRSALSQVYHLMGELEKAEAHAHQAREIDEGLGLIRQLRIDYYNLAQIARARGDEAQAAQWDAKENEVEMDMDRRARGVNGADAGPRQ
jgi:tetratricopeptide (TPR) repeat protein